jgi:hypothetical protein
MKLNLNTLILLLTALLLGGGVYLFEQQQAPQQTAADQEETGTPIFAFKEDQVQSFNVKKSSQILAFQRTKRSFPHTWWMHSPKQAPANEASIAYLLNLLATGRSDRTLTIPATQRREFGLAQPMATIEVKLNDQQSHRLVLGKPNFNQSALYAQIDPPAQASENLEVLLVPTAFEEAVNRPLSEWQLQPSQERTNKPASPDIN